MARPIALDLFCKAGGASMGLHRAGFDVVGVDIEQQPRYPFRFIQADALNLPFDLHNFDFIWASPPCQAYVAFNAVWNRSKPRNHPRLIEPVRALLGAGGVPYVIENVVGAPLRNAIRLCGSSFGLKVRRHRLFEASFPIASPPCAHGTERPIGVYGDHPQGHYGDGYRMPRAKSVAEASAAMDIDWMVWRELTQAIPPAYAEHIGRAAILHARPRIAA